MKHKPRNPTPGSMNDWLFSFEVGERRWVETTLETYKRDATVYVSPACRRPEPMEGMQFCGSLHTAISAKTAGDITYLLCVERVK